MIAIPLDSQDGTTVSKEYVNAPYFALLDNVTGYYKVIENTKKDTMIVDLLQDHGADMTVCRTMDDSISKLCSQRGVSIYEAPTGSISIDEVFVTLSR